MKAFINPDWRILTIGDGDLSFSRAIHQTYKPKLLTATVLDSHPMLTEKYGAEHLTYLTEQGVRVITEFDLTRPSTWQGIQKKYDLVLFQFPLIPGFKSQADFQKVRDVFGEDFSVNTLNRRLLRKYLEYSFRYWLSLDGARLACISSKDVKPYIEWNIEHQIASGLPIELKGSLEFDIHAFPGYRIRNVDRDKHVKGTAGRSYFWSDSDKVELSLEPFIPLIGNACQLCHAGPFITALEQEEHEKSRKHQRMLDFDRQWQTYLKDEK